MTTEARSVAKELHKHNDEIYLSLVGTRSGQVYAFHQLYDCPVHYGDVTTQVDHMSTERIQLRLELILEEVRELLADGFGTDVVYKFKDAKGDCGYYQNLSDALKCAREDGHFNVVEAADALADISYVVDGFALELGVNLDAVLDEVHASNLTKSDADGNPIYRTDGKVLKGPFYVKPDIASVVFKKAE